MPYFMSFGPSHGMQLWRLRVDEVEDGSCERPYESSVLEGRSYESSVLVLVVHAPWYMHHKIKNHNATT